MVGIGCALSASVFLAACNSTSSSQQSATPAISVSSVSRLLAHQSQLNNQLTRWTPPLAKQLYTGTALTNEDLNGTFAIKLGLNHAPKGYKDLYSHLITQSAPATGSQFPQMMVVEDAVNTTKQSAKVAHPTANEHAQILLEERTSTHSPWRISANPTTFVSLLPRLDSVLSTQVNPNSLVMTPSEAVSATTQTFSSWIGNLNINYHQSPKYFPQALDYKTSPLNSYNFASLQDYIAPTVLYTNTTTASYFTWTASQTALGAPITVRVPGGALVFYNAVLTAKLTANNPGSGYYDNYTTNTPAKVVTTKTGIQYAVFDPTKLHHSGAKQPLIKVVGISGVETQYDGISTSGKVLSS